MQVERYKTFLGLLGGALIAAGVFQIAGGTDSLLALYNAAAGRKLSLSFDLSPKYVLLIAAGVLVQLDLARAASIVRWLAIFFAAGLASYLLMTPVYIPLGYLLAELWLTPSDFLKAAIYVAPVFIVLFVVIYLLGRRRVVAFCKARRVKMRPALVPIVCGALLAAPPVYSMATILDGAFVKRAKELAIAQSGPGYGYFVKRYGYRTTTTGGPNMPTVTTTTRTATVMAYNFHEIRPIEVEWTE